MTTANHASAGTQSYGYNHANQRVFVRNGNTVTYYLYGLGGERLMEFQETCTGGACGGYTETQRWIYFAGRKMFSKTGSTLKAVTPTRLASEARHFPYGETDGPPPADTKDYFATYRRDGTGLDYAWNRYYSPAMGRFTTADPYGGSEDAGLPESWNRYSYAGNDPGNRTDSTGLFWDPFSLLQGPVFGDWGAGPFSMPDIWGLPWFVPFGLPQPEYPITIQPDRSPTHSSSGRRNSGTSRGGFPSPPVDIMPSIPVDEMGVPLPGVIFGSVGGADVAVVITIGVAAPEVLVVVGGIVVAAGGAYLAWEVGNIARDYLNERRSRSNLRRPRWRVRCSVHSNGTTNHESVGVVEASVSAASAAEAIMIARPHLEAQIHIRYGLTGFHTQHCNAVPLSGR